MPKEEPAGEKPKTRNRAQLPPGEDARRGVAPGKVSNGRTEKVRKPRYSEKGPVKTSASKTPTSKTRTTKRDAPNKNAPNGKSREVRKTPADKNAGKTAVSKTTKTNKAKNVAGQTKSKRLPKKQRLLIAGGVGLAFCILVGAVFVNRLESLGTNVLLGGIKVYAQQNGLDPLQVQPLPQRSVLLAADGTEIATLYLENRIGVPYQQLPPALVDAIVSIEDKRFWQHDGVDPRAVTRALLANLRRESLQGGSTITQQYVKNILESQATNEEDRRAAVETTITRKLIEAWYANEIERRLSKELILEGYLNTVYFGEGAYGIGAAAERYFSKQAADLTLAESALLAGLVRGPSQYSPIQKQEAAIGRRNVVLQQMLEQSKISEQEYQQAVSEPVTLSPSTVPNGCIASQVPFFCEWLKLTLENEPALGASVEERRLRVAAGGLTITTTLDLGMQDGAQAAVNNTLGLDNRVAGAAVSVEPGTGYVKAMAVNRVYGNNEEANETSLILPALGYQVGSTFKPFTLATALEDGYSLDMMLPGGEIYQPSTLDNPSQGYFSNAESASFGAVNLTAATVNSVNTAYVQLIERVGVLNTAETARRLGLRNLPTQGDNPITEREGSLTLGAREATPVEMAAAYATFANGGAYCEPTGVAKIVDRDGKDLNVQPRCEQRITPAVANTITAVLAQVVTSGTGTAGQVEGHQIAGKTGTTQNFGAAWFVGYTPTLSTSVWVGDPRGPAYPLVDVAGVSRVFGGTLPARIFSQAMSMELAGIEPRPLPGVDLSYLGEGRRVMPNMVGVNDIVAKERLGSMGLNVVVEGEGFVRQTIPAAGEPIEGTEVRVVLGEG